MNNALWTAAVLGGLALTGCGDHHSSTTSVPAVNAPTDFVNYVIQQVPMQPAFGSAPASTTSLTGDLGLGNAGAFAAVTFGTGDALPAGTYQAVVACSQAGTTACNPATSADLNSNLN